MKRITAAALALVMTWQVAVGDTRDVDSLSADGDLVRTEQGLVQGKNVGQVREFLGLPFAAPPVGELRWRAPAPPAPWKGVREATDYGSMCIQPGTDAAGKAIVKGSEDCLYLNVFRPSRRRNGELLPVMIFVHGGGNIRQDASSYDPSALVESNGILVVTVNYRLSVFGFLALPSLDAEAADTSSGNYGLLDQQAAMRWVRANIRQFGGDPANVTVAGESAGAIDLCASLVSPGAAGLFRKAILESMYCPTATHDEALAVSAPVAAKLACTDVQTQSSCMRSIAAAEVLAAAQPMSFVVGGGKGFNASPNFGNRLLPLSPAQALASGSWNRSRILIGSNHDEAALFVAAGFLRLPPPRQPGVSYFPISPPALYRGLVQNRFGSLQSQVLAQYPLEDFSNTFIAYSDEVTDPSPLGCEVSRWADAFALAADTFRYEFNEATAAVPTGLGIPAGFSIGAYHGSELQFLLGTSFEPGPQTDPQRRLSHDMIHYWGQFVREGNPNGPGLGRWPRYEPQGHQILSLSSAGSTVIDNFEAEHRCAFWAVNTPK